VARANTPKGIAGEEKTNSTPGKKGVVIPRSRRIASWEENAILIIFFLVGKKRAGCSFLGERGRDIRTN